MNYLAPVIKSCGRYFLIQSNCHKIQTHESILTKVISTKGPFVHQTDAYLILAQLAKYFVKFFKTLGVN